MNSSIRPKVTFDHLTVNTGHNHRQTSYELDSDSLECLSPLTAIGRHSLGYIPGAQDFNLLHTKLQPGHSVFSVFRDRAPLVTCHACLDISCAPEIWAHAIEMHRKQNETYLKCLGSHAGEFSSMPFVRKPSGLFLTVHFHAPLIALPPSRQAWLGSFEPALYYAFWVDYRKAIQTPSHSR